MKAPCHSFSHIYLIQDFSSVLDFGEGPLFLPEASATAISLLAADVWRDYLAQAYSQQAMIDLQSHAASTVIIAICQAIHTCVICIHPARVARLSGGVLGQQVLILFCAEPGLLSKRQPKYDRG